MKQGAKKGARFTLALWAAKTSAAFLHALGRNGNHLPGLIALKICPDFLKKVPKPEKIIGVTGTNGKTTCCNLLDDILPDCGICPLNNRAGGNVAGGVATSLASGTSWTGKARFPLAVLEMDERSAERLFPYVQPDILLVTNLFRDSYERNAHAEYIFDLLDANIPAKTKLILNADDLISSRLCPQNERVTFGIAQMEEDWLTPQNIVRDISACPVCDTPLCFDFVRYNHIGRAHCPKCGFASQTPDYEITGVSHRTFCVRTPAGEEHYPKIGDNVTDWYNTLAAVTVLREMGFSQKAVSDSLSRHHILTARYEKTDVGSRSVIMQISKGQNPVGTSRALDFVRRYPGRKAVVLLSEDIACIGKTSENTAWIYDADFEFLLGDDITQIVIPYAHSRAADLKLRLLLAGVEEKKITVVPNETAAADAVNLAKADTVFVLFHIHTFAKAKTVKERLLQRMQNN